MVPIITGKSPREIRNNDEKFKKTFGWGAGGNRRKIGGGYGQKGTCFHSGDYCEEKLKWSGL